MNVLFFYQHFWPDSPPYANMLRAIGSHLGEGEHTVSVLTGEPSYKAVDREGRIEGIDTVDGVKIRRLRLLTGSRKLRPILMLTKAVWPVRALFVVLWAAFKGQRQDVIVAATIPPVVNGLCGLVAAKLTGAKFIYHLQDIYPEIGSAGGLWNDDSFRHRVLLALDSFTCRRADQCIVLSQDMADALEKRGVPKTNARIINNFMLVGFDSTKSESPDTSRIEATEHLEDAQGRLRVVFAGNLGRFQGLEVLLRAYLGLPDLHTEIELHFLGEGAAMQTLVDMAHECRSVFFHGHRPFEQASALMADCDAGIVSIQPDVFRFAYPSKTLSYLGQGLPIFALVEEQSVLAREIAELQLGVSASNDDVDAVMNGFLELWNFLRSDANDRIRIRQITDSLYSRPVAMNHWTSLMHDLQSSQAPTESIS